MEAIIVISDYGWLYGIYVYYGNIHVVLVQNWLKSQGSDSVKVLLKLRNERAKVCSSLSEKTPQICD